MMKRRDFMRLGTALTAGAVLHGCAETTDQHRRTTARGERARPAEEEVVLSDVFEHYEDAQTGAHIYVLTPGEHRERTLHPAHPQWTPRAEFLVFASERSGNGMQPHALQMTTGRIRPLLEHPAEDFVMTWRSGLLYYVHEGAVYVTDVAAAFEGEADARRAALLPAEVSALEGGLSVDAGGRTLYFGGVLEPGARWCLAALDLREGRSRLLAPLDFQIGHVQANPYLSGEVLFCREAGGDTPERIWFVEDGGNAPRPLYQGSFEEWGGHAVWWGTDRAIFTVPEDEQGAALPYGVAWADKHEGTLHVLSRFPARHAHGSPDGRWAIGGDLEGQIWLIRVETGERRLWTQGHNANGHTAPLHASFTPDSQGLVFTSRSADAARILLAELPEWRALPREP